METNQIFYEWVPKYLRYTILFLLTLVVLCANGVYLGITANMYSDLGVYSEPYTMATNALYIGMGSGMIFLIRLALRFTGKTLIITGFVVMLLMNLICATTSSPLLTIVASLVLGFSKMLTIGQIYLAWLLIWSKKGEASSVYPFFYFIALAGLNFITWLTTHYAYLYAWRYSYILMAILIIVSIALSILFFQNHKLTKKIPLYQLDIPGLLLLISSMMLINYVAVFGKVEDWFSSNKIMLASFGAVILILLFIKREFMLKRPLLDLRLFEKFSVWSGLLLFLLLGVLSPTTFQSALSGNILHFELIRNAELSLFLIPGILIGSLVTFFWYRRNYDVQVLIIMGFAAFVIYHIMMYNRFVNDLNILNFVIPSVFRGFGLAVLYVAIGLYTGSNLPIAANLKVVGLILIVRSFLSTGITGGLYNYLLYAGTNRHLSGLASEVDANDPAIWAHNNMGEYQQAIVQQASLAAMKEISGTIIIFGLTVVILLTAVLAYRKVREVVFTNL